jgi:hypothetical protein
VILSFRPSTPIEDVLRHRFGDKWVENMQNKQANIKKEKSVVKVKIIHHIFICLFYSCFRLEYL